MTKNTATPTSRRAAYAPTAECPVSTPAKTAAWVARTASAAIARRESNSGKRVARAFIAQYLARNAPAPPGFRAGRRCDRRRRGSVAGARALHGGTSHGRHRRLVVLPLAGGPDRAWTRLSRPVSAAPASCRPVSG